MADWYTPPRGDGPDEVDLSDHDVRYRLNQEIREGYEDLFEELRDDPQNRWAIWAYYPTLGTAATRPYGLRKVGKYKKYNVEWRARRFPTPNQVDGAVVVVRWKHSSKTSPIHKSVLPPVRRESSFFVLDFPVMIASGAMEEFSQELMRALETGTQCRIDQKYVLTEDFGHPAVIHDELPPELAINPDLADVFADDD